MKKIHFVGIAGLAIILVWLVAYNIIQTQDNQAVLPANTDSTWIGPSIYLDHSTQGEERELIIYGQDLIAHTAKYL
jgi:thiosulfate dehydrogenase